MPQPPEPRLESRRPTPASGATPRGLSRAEARSLSRAEAREPEPLRRKRVQPVSDGQRRRRIVHVLLIFITVVLLVDALVGEKGLLDTMRARRQHMDVAAGVEGLKRENHRLREDIRRLRDDPRTIESIAREELGLIRPGELLFIIRDR